ncbi:hypothetical protein HA402_008445 [Bradysia odoriphaga]|nr:hypothetical protein HA402_008445 [Bradysia odoriphaga]
MDIGEYLANIAAFANTQTEIEWVTDLSALIPPTSAVDAEAIDALLSTNIRWNERNIDELREFYSSF